VFPNLIIVKKASRKEISVLSKKLLVLLMDKNSQVYQENVAKFGIPEEYVRKAFAEENLVKAVAAGKATFYLALEDQTIIGFAQTILKNEGTAELDRIIVFPEHARKGIGTKLLEKVVEDLRQKGIGSIIVKTGKYEEHARRFYEKNGFQQIKEETVHAPWGKSLELVIYRLDLKLEN